MTRVLATGAFDVLHPGLIHYLREAAALGDELVVVVARDDRRTGLLMDEETRRTLVAALEMVDEAVLGGAAGKPMLDAVAEVAPDVVALGHDQPFDADELAELLGARGLTDIAVERLDRYEGQVASSSQIRSRIHNIREQDLKAKDPVTWGDDA